jgi:flagellar biosynthesis protein FlhB
LGVVLCFLLGAPLQRAYFMAVAGGFILPAQSIRPAFSKLNRGIKSIFSCENQPWYYMVKTVGIVVRASYLKRCNIINGIKPEK